MLRFKSFSPPSPFLDQGPGEGRGPAEFHDLARILKFKKPKNRFIVTVTVTLQFARINELRAARKNGRYRMCTQMSGARRAIMGDKGCAQKWAARTEMGCARRERMRDTGCAQEWAARGAQE